MMFIFECSMALYLNELKFYTELGIRRMKGEKIPETLYEDSQANDPLGIR